MFLLTRVKSNQSRGSNRLTPRLTQQVPGGGNRVGMQPVSRLAMESQSHSARIKYSATSIHLGRCSYRGNIRPVLGTKKEKRKYRRGAELSCTVLQWRRDQYETLTSQRSRLNLKCWLGRCTSVKMFLPTQVKHKSVSRGPLPRALPLHQRLVGKDELNIESMME